MILYADKEKTRIVPEADPAAHWVINDVDPREFAGLVADYRGRVESIEAAVEMDPAPVYVAPPVEEPVTLRVEAQKMSENAPTMPASREEAVPVRVETFGSDMTGPASWDRGPSTVTTSLPAVHLATPSPTPVRHASVPVAALAKRGRGRPRKAR